MILIISVILITSVRFSKGNNISCIDGQGVGKHADGLWTNAWNTMTYHRKMMNEYLCRNYLASEIVDTLNNRTIDKRQGKPSVDMRLARESMLDDSGSRKYKDWLSRSTTLQDIYRHYEGTPDGEGPILQGSQTVGDGEVTGYALLGEKVAGHGLGDFGPGYGYHHFEFDDDDDHEDKGMKLKEIFDLALTAIAFLAFGTFVTESMIYGFGVQNQEAQMMIVSPMPAVNGISFKSNLEDSVLPNPEERSFSDRNNVFNEMSRRVLASIEALLIMDKDGGECLKRVLCESNKYSRNLSGTQKIWLPIWSFGASWIAGKFAKDDYSLLDNLKAVLFGFGDANCKRLYGKCDGKLRKKRK